MESVKVFKAEYPKVWKKISEDNSFQTKTSIVMGPDVIEYDRAIDAISCFLESVTENHIDVIKSKLSAFFHLNKFKGKVFVCGADKSIYLAISIDKFIAIAKKGLQTSPLSVDADPAYQDKLGYQMTEGFLNDVDQTLSSSWENFCNASPLQWCFYTDKFDGYMTEKRSLNCRLGLKSQDLTNCKNVLIEIKPGEVRIPTCIDAGSNLYENWVPGGKTEIASSCKKKDSLKGLDELVFRPNVDDEIVSTDSFSPCQRF